MQDLIRRDSSVELAADARFRAVCGEGVVLNQETADVLVINPVGLRVLELIEEDGLIAEILVRLQDEYDVDVEVLERDVLAFLNEIVATGAVRPSVGATAP